MGGVWIKPVRSTASLIPSKLIVRALREVARRLELAVAGPVVVHVLEGQVGRGSGLGFLFGLGLVVS